MSNLKEIQQYEHCRENNFSEWHIVWEYHKELDNLYHRRFNFFLVAESMLIVSFATIVSFKQDNDLLPILISIAVLGIVYTCVWYWANKRIVEKIWFLKNHYLEKKSKIYRDYMKLENNSDKDWRSKPHYEYMILPLATLIFWISIFLFVLEQTFFWESGIIFGIIIFLILIIVSDFNRIISNWIYKLKKNKQ